MNDALRIIGYISLGTIISGTFLLLVGFKKPSVTDIFRFVALILIKFFVYQLLLPRPDRRSRVGLSSALQPRTCPRP
jgi:hypothetical protein